MISADFDLVSEAVQAIRAGRHFMLREVATWLDGRTGSAEPPSDPRLDASAVLLDGNPPARSRP